MWWLGLLSAHMLASDPTLGLYPGYDGDLLRLATELGEILLSAFDAKEVPATRVPITHLFPICCGHVFFVL